MKKYYTSQTEKALTSFPFSTPLVHKELIYALCEVKKAAALAHKNIGELDSDIADGIVGACDLLLSGTLDDQFPLPFFQGGAGTSINMNVNEVLASKAEELLHQKGIQKTVHPNDHVNRSQSTNDVNPTALKIASLNLCKDLIKSITFSITVFEKKTHEFMDIKKLARTHVQDAIPTTLGEEFGAYTAILKRHKKRIEEIVGYFYETNLGGTAIGDGLNASKAYTTQVYTEIQSITGLPLRQADNMMSQTSSQTDFCMLSQGLVLLTLDMSKIASDLRLLSSGPRGGFGEITLRELQAGSSIMPGKVNPVLPESVNQLYFLVSGNNLTIEHAAQASQLELGVMFPVLAYSLLSSLKLTSEVLSNFSDQCVKNIKANTQRCLSLLEASTAYATLLTPRLGYDVVSAIVKESVKTGETIRTLVIQKKLLTDKEFTDIVTS